MFNFFKKRKTEKQIDELIRSIYDNNQGIDADKELIKKMQSAGISADSASIIMKFFKTGKLKKNLSVTDGQIQNMFKVTAKYYQELIGVVGEVCFGSLKNPFKYELATDLTEFVSLISLMSPESTAYQRYLINHFNEIFTSVGITLRLEHIQSWLEKEGITKLLVMREGKLVYSPNVLEIYSIRCQQIPKTLKGILDQYYAFSSAQKAEYEQLYSSVLTTYQLVLMNLANISEAYDNLLTDYYVVKNNYLQTVFYTLPQKFVTTEFEKTVMICNKKMHKYSD